MFELCTLEPRIHSCRELRRDLKVSRLTATKALTAGGFLQKHKKDHNNHYIRGSCKTQ